MELIDYVVILSSGTTVCLGLTIIICELVDYFVEG